MVQSVKMKQPPWKRNLTMKGQSMKSEEEKAQKGVKVLGTAQWSGVLSMHRGVGLVPSTGGKVHDMQLGYTPEVLQCSLRAVFPSCGLCPVECCSVRL